MPPRISVSKLDGAETHPGRFDECKDELPSDGLEVRRCPFLINSKFHDCLKQLSVC